jgi:D-alanyl-D-alanine carboxypeptidase
MWQGLSARRRIAGIVALTLVLATYAGREAAAAPQAAIVVDAKSGEVLYSEQPDSRRYPASLTKMMTLYMLFAAINSREVSLRTEISMSPHCAAQPPTKLGLKPGQKIRVRDAILALVTESANDVACAVGEHISGTESAFAHEMTALARRLGMTNTVFRNASGLPDPAQVTTARDMATLGRALQDDFPRSFSYFRTKSFRWNDKVYPNHNKLLGRVEGVNGIKTGYTRASGFNLVCSAKRGRSEIIAVVLGGSSGAARDARMTELLEEYLPPVSTVRRLFQRQ